MKIRIVKSNTMVTNFGFLDRNLLKKNWVDTEDIVEVDLETMVTYLHNVHEMNRVDARWALNGLVEFVDAKFKESKC